MTGNLHPALHTRLCDLLGIQYPIVQTGMGFVAGPGLTAATSQAGGLGILAASTMSFAVITIIGGPAFFTDRSFSRTARPLRRGIITSSMIRSGASRSARIKPS